MIGGQSGVSGHLSIGNNVNIGGHSGVLSNLKDDSKVIGFPSVPIKDFLRKRNNDK
jgi:UDP-3-O-[3-hydroxymyristoyl] glucosamine N-acyltransferase